MKFTEKFRLPLYEATDRVLKEQFNETNRKVEAALEGKADSGHTHTAAGVGAAPASHSHTAAQVGAVPAGRKVNGKPLSSDITLTAADVGAAAAGHSHTLASLGLATLAGIKIAYGNESFGSASESSTSIDYSSAGFTSNPYIITTYWISSFSNSPRYPMCLTDINTTHATVRGSGGYSFSWLAIGV